MICFAKLILPILLVLHYSSANKCITTCLKPVQNCLEENECYGELLDFEMKYPSMLVDDDDESDRATYGKIIIFFKFNLLSI